MMPMASAVAAEIRGLPFARRLDAIVEYLTALLALKRTAPGEDLVTDLVVAADGEGALSEQEMLSTIFQLIVAGHDTTSSLIGNGWRPSCKRGCWIHRRKKVSIG